MIQIVEKHLAIQFPPRRHVHVLLCQIPNDLERRDMLYRLAQPEQNFRQVKSILQMLINGSEATLKNVNLIIFPESILPYTHLTETLDLLDQLPANTITIIGLGPFNLATYRELLRRYAEDNQEALETLTDTLQITENDDLPVNSCLIAVKEMDGRLRLFFEAKSHPFVGEESLDNDHFLYRGKVFTLFRCQPYCFNFMALICMDYIYRDIYQSNISVIIQKANQIFFESRQQLDLLAVIECNPKPEHKAFRDVINGFYGEYLERTPGVKDTVTLFCNTSAQTHCDGCRDDSSFGHSSIILSASHKIEQTNLREYSTDNFNGLPVCRMRFGDQTRLYYFNLPFFHELDPRTTRTPIRVHGIYRPEQNGWTRMKSSELLDRHL
jgi:hypothetical protein